MLVISLRGVNFRFWSHLGCSGKTLIIFSGKVFFSVARPDRSPMGVLFKISMSIPVPFESGHEGLLFCYNPV